MAARSIGSLTVSFGLVAIPVKLYTATQSANAISFNLLHKTCGSRLKQQYICQKEGVVVERDDMVKGYEFAKEQYVRFAPEEIKALEEVGTHSVEISEFVPIESIDPVYYDKTYYLAPDKGAAKPYALLTEALRQAGRCGVGRWAARGKGYIVILRPIGDVLAMQQLHYSTDVRRASEVEVPKPEVKPAELKLAQQLIDQQTAEKFDAEAYKDEVRGRIEAAVETAVASIRDLAKETDSKDQIAQVAGISAADEEIGSMIAEAIANHRVSTRGVRAGRSEAALAPALPAGAHLLTSWIIAAV